MAPTSVQLARLFDQYGGLIYRDLVRRTDDEGYARRLLPRVFARASQRWERHEGGANRLLWLVDIAVAECTGRILNPGLEFDVDEWLLERSVAGDLSKGEQSRLLDRLDAEPELESRLRAIRARDDAFGRGLSWDDLKEEVARLAEEMAETETRQRGEFLEGRLRYRRAIWAGAFFGLLFVVVGAWIGPGSEPQIPSLFSAPHTGGPVSLLPKASDEGSTMTGFIHQNGRARQLEAGEVLRPGTRVQFRVQSDSQYVAMLGVDGDGQISVYVPMRGDVSLPWTPGPPQPLGTALELSEVGGAEVFLAFMSDEPLSVIELRSLLAARVAAKDDAIPALLRLVEKPEGGATEVGAVYIRKP